MGVGVGVIVGLLLAWWIREPAPPAPSPAPAPAPSPAVGARAPVGPPRDGATATARPPAPSRDPAADDPPLDAAAVMELDVRVLDGAGAPVAGALVRAWDCDGNPALNDALGVGVPWRTFPDGGRTLTVPAGTCRVQARRRDGALYASSEAVEATGEPGDRVPVALRLPGERAGGIGIVLDPHPDGVSVSGVHLGSPAARAGLEPGDVIVEVEGLPAGSLEIEEFVEVMTGPEGTDVRFRVRFSAADSGLDDGEATEEVVLTRAFLPLDGLPGLAPPP